MSLSARSGNAEFLWQWGEFRAAVTFIESTLPHHEKAVPIANNSTEKKKDKERQWYALSLDWYLNIKNPPPLHKTREAFNTDFEDFLQEIREKKRKIPRGHSVKIYKFIESFSADTKDKEAVRLTKGFKASKLYGTSYKAALQDGLDNAENLPPVGFDAYPLKK